MSEAVLTGFTLEFSRAIGFEQGECRRLPARRECKPKKGGEEQGRGNRQAVGHHGVLQRRRMTRPSSISRAGSRSRKVASSPSARQSGSATGTSLGRNSHIRHLAGREDHQPRLTAVAKRKDMHATPGVASPGGRCAGPYPLYSEAVPASANARDSRTRQDRRSATAHMPGTTNVALAVSA